MNDTPGVGHNSGGVAGERLRSLIERIERLNEEKAALQADIKEVFSEAKAAGFDAGIMRLIIKLRTQDLAQRQEREALLALYKEALGIDI